MRPADKILKTEAHTHTVRRIGRGRECQREKREER